MMDRLARATNAQRALHDRLSAPRSRGPSLVELLADLADLRVAAHEVLATAESSEQLEAALAAEERGMELGFDLTRAWIATAGPALPSQVSEMLQGVREEVEPGGQLADARADEIVGQLYALVEVLDGFRFSPEDALRRRQPMLVEIADTLVRVGSCRAGVARETPIVIGLPVRGGAFWFASRRGGEARLAVLMADGGCAVLGTWATDDAIEGMVRQVVSERPLPPTPEHGRGERADGADASWRTVLNLHPTCLVLARRVVEKTALRALVRDADGSDATYDLEVGHREAEAWQRW